VALTGTALKSGDLLAAPGGVMYVTHNGTSAGVSRIDGANVTSVVADVGSVGLLGDQLFVASHDSQLLQVYDATTLVEDPNDVQPLELASGHAILFTPF